MRASAPYADKTRVVPAWYLSEGCSGRSALESLATIKAGRARMVPGDVAGHRVGWFPESALVFAEGHPAPGDLGRADDLSDVLERLELDMGSMGVLVSPSSRAGVRRLDAAVDLATDSRSEGLAILAGVAALTPPGGKVVPWRNGRCVEGVFFKTSRGATRARVYDKGVEAGLAPRGRLIRPEAQCRWAKGLRREVEELTTDYVRAQFWRRLAPLWEAAQGVKIGGHAALIERVRTAMERGELSPSRARSLVGYLVLAESDVPQGPKRTRYELDRVCRRLGLGFGSGDEDDSVDLGAVLEECLDSDEWRRR